MIKSLMKVVTPATYTHHLVYTLECIRCLLPRTFGKLMFLLLSYLLLLTPAQTVQAHAGHGGASDDAHWAALAHDYPAFKLPGLSKTRLGKQSTYKSKIGAWGDIIQWPHIAVTAANLPDGRILTLSSFGRYRFVGGQGKEFTYAATWNPDNGNIIEHNHPAHDLFAAHLTLLEDGRLYLTGGNTRSPKTSFFDYQTNQWSLGDSMHRGRWYPTTLSLPDGSVMTALGSAGGEYPELWKEAEGWKVLTGIDLQKAILHFNHYEREWWPLFHVDPRGKVFHSGPTPTMHVLDMAGLGSIRQVGPEIHEWYPKHGVTVMYDEGKLLVAGGAISGSNQKSTNKAMIIDINGAIPVVTPVAPMKYPRKFHNGVILPTGEVMVVGGNTTGLKFNDAGTILPAEIWNPQSRKWRTVASISVPRNYHSVALLLKDGRVFSSGGGLCAPCAADHPNTQIYSPAYLFNKDGSPAHRPVIQNAPDSIHHGQTLSLQSDADIKRFALVKMSGTTHAVNSDLRFLNVAFKQLDTNQYQLSMHANRNVLTPGYWMLFAINSKGVPSVAKIIQVKKQGAPVIKQPQDQAHQIGTDVRLKIQATDPNQEPLVYSARNLPAGLTINADTGLISGTVTHEQQRTVLVNVKNSTIQSEISFNWQVYPRGKIAGVSYDLFSLNNNPAPDLNQLGMIGSGVLSSMILPHVDTANLAGGYAVRLTSRIQIETDGNYTFYLTSQPLTRLSVDQQQLIEQNMTDQSEKQASLYLSAGEHSLELVYFHTQQNTQPNVQLDYQGPGVSRQTIPATHLIQDPQHNVPPVIQNKPQLSNQQIDTNATIELNLIAFDANGDPLHFSAENLPAGLQINPQSGTIFGKVETIGHITSLMTVQDIHGASDTLQINWQINGDLHIQPILDKPRLVGKKLIFKAIANGGINKRYQWDFGDGSEVSDYSNKPDITHAFSKPGRFTITLNTKYQHADGSETVHTYQFMQSIYSKHASRRQKPNVSMSVIYDLRKEGVDRLWNVNPDNHTVSVFDPFAHSKISEIKVGKKPRSLAKNPQNGFIWVVNKASASISIIDPDQLAVVDTIKLPHGSQPYGLVFSPAGHFAYVTLQAGNKLVQINTDNRRITNSLDVGAYPRHLAINATGDKIYISRYVSPPLPDENTAQPKTEINGKFYGGELLVVKIGEQQQLSLEKTIILKHSERPDSARASRGIPNFLGSVALSPDGTTAWIPSKQDNIKRGMMRDGRTLTHDTAIRSITSRIDLVNGIEQTDQRIDHDNASIASAAIYGRWGNYLFVALEGSRAIEVIDAYKSETLFRFDTGGHAPQGLVISPDGLTLYSHNFLERTITVFNLYELIYNQSLSVKRIATYHLVDHETLTPKILRGKQLFYDSKDPRLAREEYSSCAQCHNEGISDGRVWDMSGFGEGLRNTITLVGHGNKNGPLHWSGNFDEVHDFEAQIRGLSGGSGFLDEAQYRTHKDPMGLPKKGLSADLDALALYVRSLSKTPDSPYKNPDGSLTNDARLGAQLFLEKGCDECHSGPFFTDAANNNLHDIGTLKATSGKRLGKKLSGISTPTLQGLWMTAPYLHDGRAKTLQDAIKVMRNKANQPIHTTARERDLLTAYLLQIDSNTSQPNTISSGGGTLPWHGLYLLLLVIFRNTTRIRRKLRCCC